MKKLTLLTCLLAFAHSSFAASVIVQASKDNTLYESATGATSNGAGEFFFAGRTGFNASNLLRRGLLAFDIAAVIPAGSLIESVTLTLNLSNANLSVPQAATSFHRMLADWGEGTSNAGNPGGDGAPRTVGDATWTHRFFNSSMWSTPGGDFVASASITQNVGGIGAYTFSNAQMAADVQSWLNTPASNFGWIVRGAEATSFSARRFDSSENAIEANRPALTVVYVPEPGALTLCVGGFALLAIRRRARI